MLALCGKASAVARRAFDSKAMCFSSSADALNFSQLGEVVTSMHFAESVYKSLQVCTCKQRDTFGSLRAYESHRPGVEYGCIFFAHDCFLLGVHRHQLLGLENNR